MSGEAAALREPEALLATLGPGRTLLALDLSKRRIGLAGADPSRLLVTPLEVVARKRFAQDVDRIERWRREREVGALVVGLPLEEDGRFGPAAQAARDGARRFASALGLPHYLQDERYSTSEARFAAREGRWGGSRSGEPLDHFAAALVLEAFLREVQT